MHACMLSFIHSLQYVVYILAYHNRTNSASDLCHGLICNPQITFCLGAVMAISASFWFFVQNFEGRKAVYATSILMGSGGSVMLVTSLSLIAQLIGHDKVTYVRCNVH